MKRFSIINPLLSLSVGKKILLATSVSSLLTLSVFSFVYVIQEKESFLKRKTEHLDAISIIIASNSEAALSFDDAFTANDYLSSLENDPDITQATLFNRDGDLFAHFQRNVDAKPPSLPDWEGCLVCENFVSYAYPIILSEERLGTLLIKADTSSLEDTIQTATFKAVGVISLGTLLSLFISLFIQRLITRPLFELETIAKTVSTHDDYTVRATKRYDDEIGSLVESVNLMISHAERGKAIVEENNLTLEKKVSERTEELRKAMEQANAASQAKSEFLSTMSHELRTPLNAIIGMSSIIAGDEISSELSDHIRIIQTSSDSLLAIINQILDYSKIESGNLELEHRSFRPSECIEESMDMLSSVNWEKPVDFFTTIDPMIPNKLVGDETRLRQVLVNLIGNASKFTKEGYVWVNATLKKNSQNSESEELEIAVHDTGIGIPAERIGKLFKTFSQIDSSTTREFGGTGLGLAITKKLVNAMGGEIKVTSEADRGTTFSFTLPTQGASVETVSDSLRPKRILENTALSLSIPFDPLRKTLEMLLRSWGLSVLPENSQADLAIVSKFHSFPPSSDPESNTRLLTLLHPQKQSLVDRGVRSVGPINLREVRNFIQGGDKNVSSSDNSKGSVSDSLPKGIRILLAEDNKINQKVFNLLMKREGYEIDIANNGREAVAAISKTSYDIVFMDLQMPIMDGLSACEAIRSNIEIKQPWIIGFTANVESDAKPAMQKVGMNDYLSKPVSNERVRESLQRFHENTPKIGYRC
ncbi:ATP-binding protein [Puniceicoccaceae bacterium K14]|nr:ATP-binding protein [Puniceicoccaceae bacterium K14]